MNRKKETVPNRGLQGGGTIQFKNSGRILLAANADDPGKVMGGEWIEIEKGNNEEKKRLSPLRSFNLLQNEFPVKSIS